MITDRWDVPGAAWDEGGAQWDVLILPAGVATARAFAHAALEGGHALPATILRCDTQIRTAGPKPPRIRVAMPTEARTRRAEASREVLVGGGQC